MHDPLQNIKLFLFSLFPRNMQIWPGHISTRYYHFSSESRPPASNYSMQHDIHSCSTFFTLRGGVPNGSGFELFNGFRSVTFRIILSDHDQITEPASALAPTVSYNF